eukprot:403331706
MLIKDQQDSQIQNQIDETQVDCLNQDEMQKLNQDLVQNNLFDMKQLEKVKNQHHYRNPNENYQGLNSDENSTCSFKSKNTRSTQNNRLKLFSMQNQENNSADKNWPVDAIGMRENTKLLIDENGKAVQAVHRQQISQQIDFSSNSQIHNPLVVTNLDMDQKLAMLDQILSDQDFLASNEKRALKRTLKQQHYKSLLMNPCGAIRNFNRNWQSTTSEPSSPKSSTQIFAITNQSDTSQFITQHSDTTRNQYLHNQIGVGNGTTHQNPSSAISTAMSEFQSARLIKNNFRHINGAGQVHSQSQAGIDFKGINPFFGMTHRQQTNSQINLNNRIMQDQLIAQQQAMLDQENNFLLTLKNELVSLRQRLKIEITQKFQLIKELNKYKKQLLNDSINTNQKQSVDICTQTDEIHIEDMMSDKKSEDNEIQIMIEEDNYEKDNSIIYQNVSIILEDQHNFDEQQLTMNREQFSINILAPISNDDQLIGFQHQRTFENEMDNYLLSNNNQSNQQEQQNQQEERSPPNKMTYLQHHDTMKQLSSSFISLSKKYDQVHSNANKKKLSSKKTIEFEPYQDENLMFAEVNENLTRHKREKSSSFQGLESLRERNSSEKNQLLSNPFRLNSGLLPLNSGCDNNQQQFYQTQTLVNQNSQKLRLNYYDDKYWKRKVEDLIKDKQRQQEDMNKARKELSEMQVESVTLRDKIKHLTKVIERFNLKDSESPQKKQSQKNMIVPQSTPTNENRLKSQVISRRESIRLNDSLIQIEYTSTPNQGFFPMLIQRDTTDQNSEDEDNEMTMEHRQIEIDLADSYVDFSAYEQYRKSKHHKGFFSKIKSKNNDHNYYYQNDGLFVIDEEPFWERSSINNNNRTSSSLYDKSSGTKKQSSGKKSKKWVELKEIQQPYSAFTSPFNFVHQSRPQQYTFNNTRQQQNNQPYHEINDFTLEIKKTQR